MKKLTTTVFAALIALALSMPAFAQDKTQTPPASSTTKKSTDKKATTDKKKKKGKKGDTSTSAPKATTPAPK